MLAGVTEQLVGAKWGANEFQYAGSFGPADWWTPALVESLIEIGQKFAAEFRLTGVVGIDFIFDGEQLWLVEINPRYTASMEVVERLGGPIGVLDHVRACRDVVLPEALSRDASDSRWLKLICYAPQALVVDEPLHEWLQTKRAEWSLADLPAIGTGFQSGDPVCTLLTRISPDVSDLTQLAAIQEVRTRLALT